MQELSTKIFVFSDHFVNTTTCMNSQQKSLFFQIILSILQHAGTLNKNLCFFRAFCQYFDMQEHSTKVFVFSDHFVNTTTCRNSEQKSLFCQIILLILQHAGTINKNLWTNMRSFRGIYSIFICQRSTAGC